MVPDITGMSGTITVLILLLWISARVIVAANVRMLDTIRSPPDQTGDQHGYARIHQHASIQRVPDPLHPHAQQNRNSETKQDADYQLGYVGLAHMPSISFHRL